MHREDVAVLWLWIAVFVSIILDVVDVLEDWSLFLLLAFGSGCGRSCARSVYPVIRFKKLLVFSAS